MTVKKLSHNLQKISILWTCLHKSVPLPHLKKVHFRRFFVVIFESHDIIFFRRVDLMSGDPLSIAKSKGGKRVGAFFKVCRSWDVDRLFEFTFCIVSEPLPDTPASRACRHSGKGHCSATGPGSLGQELPGRIYRPIRTGERKQLYDMC